MEKNKTGKYFKYAIGEIILVVIGILIALQINNWNENKKIKSTEVYVLNEVLNNLNEDGSLFVIMVFKPFLLLSYQEASFEICKAVKS